MKAYIKTQNDEANKKRIEIVEEEDGIYLYQFNEKDDICVSDSWHLSIEEAKAQARYEFGIEEKDWFP